MALPDYIRRRAIRMRVEDDLTIDEIAERLSLSRTTVYYWVKDIPLSEHRRQVHWKKANIAAAAATRAKHQAARDRAYAQGWAEYEHLRHRVTFREFVVLYIAEGYKRSRNAVALGNSNRSAVVLATSWIRVMSTNKIGFAVQYHADQDLGELQAYWADAVQVSPVDIKLQRKSNSGQLSGRRWRSRYGVLTVRVGDTMLRARLEAWMDRVQQEWTLDSAEPHGV